MSQSIWKDRFNIPLAVLFVGVVGVVVYSMVVPWNEALKAPPLDEPTKTPERPIPPKKDEVIAVNPAPVPRPATEAPEPESPTPRVEPTPPAEAPPLKKANDEFAKGWAYRSVIGDLVEMEFGSGIIQNIPFQEPFEAPTGETAVIVEIKPDENIVIVERESDGKLFPIPRIVRTDLTVVKPAKVEAFHFSAGGLEAERIAEGVAEPVLNGEKVGRYLFAHAPSKIAYELREPYLRFTAIGYLGGDRGKVKFVVRADGADLYASDPISAPGHVDIAVDLPKDARVLELIVDQLGDKGADHSFWLEPVLEK